MEVLSTTPLTHLFVLCDAGPRILLAQIFQSPQMGLDATLSLDLGPPPCLTSPQAPFASSLIPSRLSHSQLAVIENAMEAHVGVCVHSTSCAFLALGGSDNLHKNRQI